MLTSGPEAGLINGVLDYFMIWLLTGLAQGLRLKLLNSFPNRDFVGKHLGLGTR